ncbi:hypothetical protein M9Y10_015647 [Tritrichomonas musculus]|uniref:Uncharacterized protein n=1 Tax=Tritrichomonas musculus TaxID=1915356 RepID=A0ABR2L2U7_9EUKA
MAFALPSLYAIAADVLEVLGLSVTFLASYGVVKRVGETVYVDAKVRDKIKEVEARQCCCGCGPSGLPKLHFIMKSSRKEAEEAARHYPGANGVLYHPTNTSDNFPHFHPTKNGIKIPGVHFQFPR